MAHPVVTVEGYGATLHFRVTCSACRAVIAAATIEGTTSTELGATQAAAWAGHRCAGAA